MQVILDLGQVFTLIFVLLGTEQKFSKQENGKWKLSYHFIFQPNLLFMRSIVDVANTNGKITYSVDLIFFG